MKELSRIAQGVHASTTMAIDSMFKQMKAEGMDVIGFAAGEPDFPTPEHIKEAGIQAIRDNFTKYTPTTGSLEMKEAVCQWLKADSKADYTPEQIVIGNGAKITLYTALRAVVDPGDEVILPTPAWVSYYELIRIAGGVPVTVRASEAEHFKLTPEKLEGAITAKTKAIILNNPSNPTGMAYDADQLKALAEVCEKHDLYIISDEMYHGLMYDHKPFTSIVTLGEDIKRRTILINGVSKSYAMTGWRIGFSAAEPEIARVMGNLVGHCTGSPNTISQKAAVCALTSSQEKVLAMRDTFQERRNYMVERINQIPGVSCIMPEGAFYVMMNVQGLYGKTFGGTRIENDIDFCNAFLKQGLVAVVPGDGFDAPGFVRWSYAVSMENIKEGLDRLERFLQS